jgi:hypothetical protein
MNERAYLLGGSMLHPWDAIVDKQHSSDYDPADMYKEEYETEFCDEPLK